MYPALNKAENECNACGQLVRIGVPYASQFPHPNCWNLRDPVVYPDDVLPKVKPIVITELLGDGIGPELAESVHTVAESLPAEFKFIPVDWSLENREAKGDDVIDEAEASMRETKLAVKYPTITRKRSPNALIRRRCEFSVIYRPAISIKGIHSNFKEDVNLHIVRIATGGTYDDPGQLIGRKKAVHTGGKVCF